MCKPARAASDLLPAIPLFGRRFLVFLVLLAGMIPIAPPASADEPDAGELRVSRFHGTGSDAGSAVAEDSPRPRGEAVRPATNGGDGNRFPGVLRENERGRVEPGWKAVHADSGISGADSDLLHGPALSFTFVDERVEWIGVHAGFYRLSHSDGEILSDIDYVSGSEIEVQFGKNLLARRGVSGWVATGGFLENWRIESDSGWTDERSETLAGFHLRAGVGAHWDHGGLGVSYGLRQPTRYDDVYESLDPAASSTVQTLSVFFGVRF